MKIRLSSLLVLVPLLAIVMAMGVWVQSLRKEVVLLETRVATLEINPSIQPSPIAPFIEPLSDVSRVGVPFDVEKAMRADSLRLRVRKW